jgi:hypothetical protein
MICIILDEWWRFLLAFSNFANLSPLRANQRPE